MIVLFVCPMAVEDDVVEVASPLAIGETTDEAVVDPTTPEPGRVCAP